jgi:hypothetical protein
MSSGMFLELQPWTIIVTAVAFPVAQPRDYRMEAQGYDEILPQVEISRFSTATPGQKLYVQTSVEADPAAMQTLAATTRSAAYSA